MDSSAVYRALQRHMNRLPVGYPATRSGVEIRLLQRVFTPEQARVAVHLGHKHKGLDAILATAREVVETREELRRILDETVSRGGIFRRRVGDEVEYALMPFVLWGIYEHQLKRLEPGFLEDVGEYLSGELGFELATSKLPKMRVIPIEKSVSVEHRVATYDELHQLIDAAGDRIAIQDCMCKKVFDMQSAPCKTTERREVCMSFGDLAALYVDEGWGRMIDRSEALDIARLNEEEGLVLMPSNGQSPSFMCACCSDCCGMLGMIKQFPKPADVVGSNYFARVDPARCEGCETCAGRCPMDAVALVNGHSGVDLKRCIGCGLCVPACEAGALDLVRKEQEVLPPPDMDHLYDAILADKSTLTGRVRNTLLKTFLRVATRMTS